MSKITRCTKKIETKEIKSPNPVKVKDVTAKWEIYLGGGIYSSMNPLKGNDPDRIFSEDGTRAIRFARSEMNTSDKDNAVKKFHYHEESWMYDPVIDTMTIGNILRRIQSQPKRKNQ